MLATRPTTLYVLLTSHGGWRAVRSVRSVRRRGCAATRTLCNAAAPSPPVLQRQVQDRTRKQNGSPRVHTPLRCGLVSDSRVAVGPGVTEVRSLPLPCVASSYAVVLTGFVKIYWSSPAPYPSWTTRRPRASALERLSHVRDAHRFDLTSSARDTSMRQSGTPTMSATLRKERSDEWLRAAASCAWTRASTRAAKAVGTALRT